MLVSSIQQTDSVIYIYIYTHIHTHIYTYIYIHIYIHILFQILFHDRFYYKILSIDPFATQGLVFTNFIYSNPSEVKVAQRV